MITGNGLAGKPLTVQIGRGRTYEVGAAVVGALAEQDANSAFAAVQVINSSSISGLTVTAANSQTFRFEAPANGAVEGRTGDMINLTINGVKVFGDAGYTFDTTNGNHLSTGDLVNQLNSISVQTGVTASLNKDSSLQLSASDGRNITVTQSGKEVIDTHRGNGRRLGEALQGTVSFFASGDIILGEAVQQRSTADPRRTSGAWTRCETFPPLPAR